MRTPINDVRVALPGSPEVGAITAGVSGCGGAAYAPTPPAAASTDIAQQRGDDHDASSNGGPSDRHGNL
jgi:hypothetical protein